MLSNVHTCTEQLHIGNRRILTFLFCQHECVHIYADCLVEHPEQICHDIESRGGLVNAVLKQTWKIRCWTYSLRVLLLPVSVPKLRMCERMWWFVLKQIFLPTFAFASHMCGCSFRYVSFKVFLWWLIPNNICLIRSSNPNDGLSLIRFGLGG